LPEASHAPKFRPVRRLNLARRTVPIHGEGILPQRIAHRGASREHPENTLPAIRRALELGADGIELDVHATRDGIVVVHHDPIPRAIAAPAPPGSPAIASLTWQELSSHEVAPGIGVPTLGDVLTLVGDRADVYVEIKGVGIEELVASAIRTGSARCAVHSFDHAAVERMAGLLPEVPRGLLFDEYPLDPAGAMRIAGARDVWPAARLIDSRLVERVHEVGGRVVAWTVNDRADAEALIALGVDAICTDDVRLI
jgi:glycerophosphoryl diester phosphodiesterase